MSSKAPNKLTSKLRAVCSGPSSVAGVVNENVDAPESLTLRWGEGAAGIASRRTRLVNHTKVELVEFVGIGWHLPPKEGIAPGSECDTEDNGYRRVVRGNLRRPRNELSPFRIKGESG